MRAWVSTVLAAVLGGGVTAAALMIGGVVETGESPTVIDPPLASKGAPAMAASAAAGALSAGEIYRRRAPGVVFIRAQTLRTSPSPFDLSPNAQRSESTGSGFVIDERRPDPDQRPRGRRGDRDPGDVLRQPHGQRDAGRQGR